MIPQNKAELEYLKSQPLKEHTVGNIYINHSFSTFLVSGQVDIYVKKKNHHGP